MDGLRALKWFGDLADFDGRNSSWEVDLAFHFGTRSLDFALPRRTGGNGNCLSLEQ